MKAGDLVRVSSMSYSGTEWRVEGVAKLIERGDEKEVLNWITINSGEEIPGPFEQWRVRFSDDDGEGIYTRWIRDADKLQRLL